MQPAISRPHSLALDVVRAAAALVVAIFHAAQIGLYTGPWPFSDMVQHVAVVIFFVLSGLVIADSTFGRKLPPAEYVIARIARIAPVALVGIIAGNLVWLIAQVAGLNLHQPPGFETGDLRGLALSLGFMSMSPGATGPVANPPFWSLCYEVWYYALFGVAIYLKGRRRWIWLIAAAIAAGPRILLLMPVWLTGVVLQSCLSRWQMRRAQGVGAVLVGSAVVVVSAIYAPTLKSAVEWLTKLDMHGLLYFSQFWMTDWLAAPAVAAILAGTAPLACLWSDVLERASAAIRLAAGSSFTLYIVHWPLISLMVAVGIKANSIAGFAALLALVITAAMLLAAGLERRISPALRDYLRIRIRGRSPWLTLYPGSDCATRQSS